jgi:hypothetical protein
MVVFYLLLVELAKDRFYRAPHARVPRPPTHTEKLERLVRRRASRFIRFTAQEAVLGERMVHASITRTGNKVH